MLISYPSGWIVLLLIVQSQTVLGRDVSGPVKVNRVKRAATADGNKIWPNATIPYKFNSNLSDKLKELVVNAFGHWENSTCIRFREKVKHDVDFLWITSTSCGCCSLVGRVGGRQALSLKDYCATQRVAVHELGHAIGFWHEHTRPDRDEYVKVLWDNILEGQEENFKKRKSIEIDSFGRPYDYTSIMHYGTRTFSNGAGNTLSARNGAVVIKLPSFLSQEDILQANLLYNCPLKRDCQHDVEGAVSGEIISPYYPNHYLADMDCHWTIHVPPDKYIEITFNELRLQDSYKCSGDHLTIRQQSEDGHLIGQLCGSALPPPIAAKTSLWLWFHSNWFLEEKGFNISFQIKDITPIALLKLEKRSEHNGWANEGCTQVSRSKYGVYRSADLPNNGQFTSAMSCSILIDGSQSADVTGIKLEMQTHQPRAYGTDCLGDIYVPIELSRSRHSGVFESERDVDGSLDPNVWKQVPYRCNSSEAVNVIIKEPKAIIVWSSGYHRAFTLRYWIDHDECTTSSPCQHVCENTVEGYKCLCSQGFQLANDSHGCVKKVPQIADKCEQRISAAIGKIRSSTEPHQLCSYIIIRPGDKILLVFRRLHFLYPGECSLNHINVTSDRKLIATICTNDYGLELAAGESMTIQQFVNISSAALPFFAAEYRSIPKSAEECEFTMHGVSEVTSPKYPSLYPPFLDCTWKISTQRGQRLELTFIDIDIEQTVQCRFDSLRVYDGRNKKAPLMLRLCGSSNRTVPLISSGNRLTVRFTSDQSGAGRGFKLEIKNAERVI